MFCVRHCVSERVRERERDRETERQRVRERNRDRDRERQTHRQRERENLIRYRLLQLLCSLESCVFIQYSLNNGGMNVNNEQNNF